MAVTETATNAVQPSSTATVVEMTPTPTNAVQASGDEALIEMTLTPTSAVMPSSTATVVEMTPPPTEGTTVPSPAQAEPSPAGATGEASPVAPDAPPAAEPSSGMTGFAGSGYPFSVEYPADFVVSARPSEQLAQLRPLPIASVMFMNPETAASEVIELEPADLEVRVYDGAGAASLEEWLSLNGLAATGFFQTATVSGAEVCASTMIVPPCTYFVMGSDWVYQLIPITLDGRAIMDTFRLTS